MKHPLKYQHLSFRRKLGLRCNEYVFYMLGKRKYVFHPPHMPWFAQQHLRREYKRYTILSNSAKLKRNRARHLCLRKYGTYLKSKIIKPKG